MNTVTIHNSGHGSEKMEIQSHGNGLAYSINFGEAGSPMRTLFFQGDDAAQLRDEFDQLEMLDRFGAETRELWFSVLDPYL